MSNLWYDFLEDPKSLEKVELNEENHNIFHYKLREYCENDNVITEEMYNAIPDNWREYVGEFFFVCYPKSFYPWILEKLPNDKELFQSMINKVGFDKVYDYMSKDQDFFAEIIIANNRYERFDEVSIEDFEKHKDRLKTNMHKIVDRYNYPTDCYGLVHSSMVLMAFNKIPKEVSNYNEIAKEIMPYLNGFADKYVPKEVAKEYYDGLSEMDKEIYDKWKQFDMLEIVDEFLMSNEVESKSFENEERYLKDVIFYRRKEKERNK